MYRGNLVAVMPPTPGYTAIANRALDAGEVSACCNRGELDQQYNGAQLGELASGNVSPNAKYA